LKVRKAAKMNEMRREAEQETESMVDVGKVEKEKLGHVLLKSNLSIVEVYRYLALFYRVYAYASSL
jgi:hypothetical protein